MARAYVARPGIGPGQRGEVRRRRRLGTSPLAWPSVELVGTWSAHPADDELRRTFASPAADDTGWEHVAVPGHWRSAPAFAGSDGPLLYRRRFSGPAPADPRARWWLTFDGIFYLADVWLDGAYLGNTEGYFAPHSFEITGALADRTEHVLAVEVACERPRDRGAKRQLTGVFQDADYIDPRWNPGGIWRPVTVHATGPVRLSQLRVVCVDAGAERATLEIRAVLDAAAAGDVNVHTAVTAAGGSGVAGSDQSHHLAAGENRLRWRIAVDRPALWWPHSLGPAHLHDVTVAVSGPGGDSDRRTVAVGLRQVRARRWIFSVNGERLFLKGAELGPTRRALADATYDEIAADVAAAREAGLDLLRVQGHIARPELYAEADRLGMLVWQDLPLSGMYAHSVRKQAARQAQEAVDLLGHHPSIIVWCGHDEVGATPLDPSPLLATARRQLPSYWTSVLDGSIKRALERADPSRPVVAHSGLAPGLGEDSDAHLGFGSAYGEPEDLERWVQRLPRLARFAGRFVPPAPAGDSPDAAAAQAFQASVLRRQVEVLRRLKYRPAGGFVTGLLADAQPAASAAVLDHLRRPKPAWPALAAACEPVIVVADHPLAAYPPGAAVRWQVHVVNDTREPIEAALVTARLTQGDGAQQRWQWTGDVPADGCILAGTVSIDLPEDAGALLLELELDAGPVKASNSYTTTIAVPAEPV